MLYVHLFHVINLFVEGGKIDCNGLGQIISKRLKTQMTSPEELRDAFQVDTTSIALYSCAFVFLIQYIFRTYFISQFISLRQFAKLSIQREFDYFRFLTNTVMAWCLCMI